MQDGDIVKGFIGINMKRDIPHLQHFYVDTPYRTIDNARKLIKSFVAIAKELGYSKAFVHACTKEQETFIRYYFKAKKPYCFNDGVMWYLVDLGRAGK